MQWTRFSLEDPAPLQNDRLLQFLLGNIGSISAFIGGIYLFYMTGGVQTQQMGVARVPCKLPPT